MPRHSVLHSILSLCYLHLIVSCYSFAILPHHATSTLIGLGLFRRSAIAGGIDLRILPLGDSITYGEGSSDGNGYRLFLSNLLEPGNAVNYLGRVQSGTMENNDNEGYPGYPTKAIADRMRFEKPERPDMVLLMVGTNDVILRHTSDTAAADLSKLINQTIVACPEAVILVAEILPLLDSKREEKRVAYNAVIPSIVLPFADSGTHIAVVDMGAVTPTHINATDGIHPNDEGYESIAHAWYDAIVEADIKGWLNKQRPGRSISSETFAEWTPMKIALCAVVALLVVGTIRSRMNIATGFLNLRRRSFG